MATITPELWGQFAKMSSVVNWGNPLPLVISSIRSKNASQLSSIRYMMIVSQLMSWTMYGVESQNDTVKMTSMFGGIVFYCYTILSTYLRQEYKMYIYFNGGILVQYFIIRELSTEILGFSSSIVQCLAAMTPIEIILKCMKTKDKSVLNPVSIIMNLPCCFLWSGYGLAINEFVIFLPNFIEFVLVFVQAVLYTLFFIQDKNSDILPQTQQQSLAKGKPNQFLAVPTSNKDEEKKNVKKILQQSNDDEETGLKIEHKSNDNSGHEDLSTIIEKDESEEIQHRQTQVEGQ